MANAVEGAHLCSPPFLDWKRRPERRRKCGGEVSAELEYWSLGGAETGTSLDKTVLSGSALIRRT